MQRSKILSVLLLSCPALALAENAQIQSTYSGTWRVIAANRASVPMNGLQNVERDIRHVWLADNGSGRFTFAAENSADYGLWAGNLATGASSQRFFQFGVTGATGPGRSGGEAGHVFHERYDSQYYVDAGPDGQRVFLARAGAPGTSSAQTSNGAWRWDGSRNIEVSRNGDSGVLGPGLGASWSISSVMRLQAGRNGQVLIDASLARAGGGGASALIKHVPGQGNTTCVLSGSTDPNYSPNVGNLVFGEWFLSQDLRTLDADGRYYTYFDNDSGVRDGFWEICNGPPRAIAVNNEPGPRGPGLTADSRFSFMMAPPMPGPAGAIYFGATAAVPSGPSTLMLDGIFLHEGGSNRPIVLQGDSGAYSPNWQGTTFGPMRFNTIAVNGRNIAFNAVATNGSTNYEGLWRITKGGTAQPVAIIGDTGVWSPGNGATWVQLMERIIYGNGDIVLRAKTSDNVYALWLFEPGQPPRRILAEGQTFALQTTGGLVNPVINDISMPSNNTSSTPRFGPGTSAGLDGWTNRDGQMLARLSLEGYGYVWAVTRPSEHIFRDDFQR